MNFDSECHFQNIYSQTWMFPVKGKGEFDHVQNEIPCHESILGSGGVA